MIAWSGQTIQLGPVSQTCLETTCVSEWTGRSPKISNLSATTPMEAPTTMTQSTSSIISSRGLGCAIPLRCPRTQMYKLTSGEELTKTLRRCHLPFTRWINSSLRYAYHMRSTLSTKMRRKLSSCWAIFMYTIWVQATLVLWNLSVSSFLIEK